jgi:hypothetical protein
MAINMAELMKGLMATQMASSNDAMNKDHSAPAVNQMMNMLSQEQAQKARQAEAMQKFLMQRQLHKEDFERRVELGKLLKGDLHAEKLAKQQKEDEATARLRQKDIMNMRSDFHKEERSELGKVKRGVGQMHDLVEITTEPDVVRMLDKLKNVEGLRNALDKPANYFLHGAQSKNPKHDLDVITSHIADIVRNKTKGMNIVDWSDKDTNAFSKLLTGIKAGTIGFVSAIGGNQAKATLDTLYNSKALQLIEGAQATNDFYRDLYVSEATHLNEAYEKKKKEYIAIHGDDFSQYTEESGLDENYSVDPKYKDAIIVSFSALNQKLQQLGEQHGLTEENVRGLYSSIDKKNKSPQEIYNEMAQTIESDKGSVDRIDESNQIEELLRQAKGE